ncbi:MAG: S8 family serine peptidase, partial [Planctomycetota bacterium]
GYDFVNDDTDPDDDHGHGTHVAGMIVANIDNNVGTAGACPKCRLMPIKVLDENNLGAWSTIAKGIVFAIEQGGRVGLTPPALVRRSTE